jgi:hypothetical protein
VITLPQFWSAPLAYALEDWCLSLRRRDIAISRRRCTD